MNVLLVAFGNAVQYRALRCAAATGVSVFVMGTKDAALLRYSRFCRRFILIPPMKDGAGADPGGWTERVEEAIRRFKIELVIAADGTATTLLSPLRSRLSARVFPLPAHETFAKLNNKWTFYEFCRSLNLPTPATWLFQDRSAILESMRRRELPVRVMVKPLEVWGGIGIRLLTAENAEQQLRTLDYAPLLVQEFIEGETIAISAFAIRGKIVFYATFRRTGRSWRVVANAALVRFATEIVAQSEMNGVVNFEAQRTPEGKIYLLECNPRMFLSLDFAALAGMNFIEMGLRGWEGFDGPALTIPEQEIRTPNGFVRSLAAPWRLSGADWRMMGFYLSDPVSFILENARLLFRTKTDF